MDTSIRKYYCDQEFSNYPEDMWKGLLDYAITIANSVEFNILRFKKGYPVELDELSQSLIEITENPKRIYPGRKSVKFHISKRIVEFIMSKGFKDWYNYTLEDISFRDGNVEFLATITHENYVIMLLTEEERDKLNEKGYNFDFEFIIDKMENDG